MKYSVLIKTSIVLGLATSLSSALPILTGGALAMEETSPSNDSEGSEILNKRCRGGCGGDDGAQSGDEGLKPEFKKVFPFVGYQVTPTKPSTHIYDPKIQNVVVGFNDVQVVPEIHRMDRTLRNRHASKMPSTAFVKKPVAATSPSTLMASEIHFIP